MISETFFKTFEQKERQGRKEGMKGEREGGKERRKVCGEGAEGTRLIKYSFLLKLSN